MFEKQHSSATGPAAASPCDPQQVPSPPYLRDLDWNNWGDSGPCFQPSWRLEIAVCNPLLYKVAMSPKLCSLLFAGTYTWGGMCSLTITRSLLELSFCNSNIIHHFGCEYSAIVSASCSDSYSQMICFIISTLNEMCSFMIILASYIFLIVTIIKLPSAGGLRKAFSTCASHLTAITIFHGVILLLYCVPNSRSSWLFIKFATVLYTVVIPMLNPFIYSLRNDDVKETIRRLVNTKMFSHPM